MPKDPHSVLESCSERDKAIILIKAICIARQDLHKLLAADKDWSRRLFPGALYLEDDPQFWEWLRGLCEAIHLPLDEVIK